MTACEILTDFAEGHIDRTTAASLLAGDDGFTDAGIDALLDQPEGAVRSYHDVARQVRTGGLRSG